MPETVFSLSSIRLPRGSAKVALAKREGLLVGISAGANAFIALQVARELGPGKRVVTVMCDTGERYFSLDEYFAS